MIELEDGEIEMKEQPIQEKILTTNEFESSDEEDSEPDGGPLKIDWLDLTLAGFNPELVGISGLPGCRFRCTRRDLKDDLEYLTSIGIQDIFVLCSDAELSWCRVPNIVSEYEDIGMTVHHHPMDEENVPNIQECMRIISELEQCINNGNKTLIHCIEGIGRSCLVASVLLLVLDYGIPEDIVIQKLRQMRGPAAIQTVKQFNFINEFRENYRQFQMKKGGSPEALSRSASR